MKWGELFLVLQAVLLLIVSSVQLSAAEQCKCSDRWCIEDAAGTANSSDRECCLWDFPQKSAATTQYEKMGFAHARTTVNAPRFCITYPIAEYNVTKNNYFVVKLDLAGPDVCIYEPGNTEYKSCSTVLQNAPVSKAVYCSGVPVSGVQSVNFSIECTDCAVDDAATFQFIVYSESFNTTQAQWCENVDTTVPSEFAKEHAPPASPNEEPNLNTPTDDGSGASDTYMNNDNNGAIATIPSFMLFITAVILSTGLLA